MKASSAKRRPREQLDDLDTAILSRLRQDGRAPSAQIARELGAPEATVRYRIDRLKARGFIVTLSVPMADRMLHRLIVAFFIKTVPGKTMEFVESIKSLRCVRFLGIGSGTYDVYLSAGFESDDEFLEFRHSTIGASDAVEKFESLHVLKTIARTYDLMVPDTNGSAGEAPLGE